jgi:G3E family GTPase
MTVVGGFLGAGKTTFLNHILSGGGGRYAVLVNDFGAVNIDASLVARHDGTTMALTNGCVCCSIGGGFIETLGRVLDGETAFDHIIVEASGVGDPWRIAEIALIEPNLRLHAVAVLADATRIETLLNDPRVGATVRGQFDRCDVVLLTKTDLVDRPAVGSATSAVARVCNSAAIVETSKAALPDLASLRTRVSASPFRAADCTTDRADHEAAFRRWSYHRPGAFDRERLPQAIAKLPPQLLRLKGTCKLADQTGSAILQVVGHSWSLAESDTESISDIALVGIGTPDLPETHELEAILDFALVRIEP